MRPALIFLFCAAPAFAQNADIQKQLIQRQQQSDAFVLQLRQSQESLKVLPSARGELESRQFSERQRLENVSERQQRDIRLETPEALRAHERYRAAEERRPFYSPIVEVPFKAAPTPPPLQPSLKGNVDVIDAPRPEAAR